MPDTPTDVSSLIALLSPPTLVASGQLSKTALCVLVCVCVCVCVCVWWGVCMLTMPPQHTAPVCGWRITEGQMTSEYGPGTLLSSALHSAYCPRVLLGRGAEETVLPTWAGAIGSQSWTSAALTILPRKKLWLLFTPI